MAYVLSGSTYRVWRHCQTTIAFMILTAFGLQVSSQFSKQSQAAEPAADGRGQLMAGAFARNINPLKLPVWVNGGIAGRQIDRITDPLHARSLVLGDGKTQIAICIVDNCILPLDLVNKAKELAQAKTGIPVSHISIAATHTHSAVSVAGTHGTPTQDDYAAILPEWIADSIAQAQQRMVPAQWGTTSVLCEKYIYCRDWLMKSGTASSSPFSGRASDSAAMNPGFDNPNKLAPIGPVDMLIPVLSIQDMQGKPLSVLATFCTHYAGAPNISADYFAVVCDRLAKSLRPDSPEAFTGLMSNSTSGNANCIDFSKPAEPFTHFDVGNYVADRILSVVPSIQYSSRITLDAELESLELAVRMPSSTEVMTAQRYIDTHFPNRLPASLDENYARETVLLSQMPPTRTVNLQAFRLNDFVITSNPCESYNETGLKIRQASPFRLTMNIGLANGHAGYLPPPEMFQLGGYTTWRCRSSCLEEQAEPKIVAGITHAMQSLYERRTPEKKVSQQTKPQSPVSPRDSLNLFETEPGFQIELVASEPQVVDPVSMQMDESGRMWVVEMRDYPTKDDTPRSRIVVLQDNDKDGFFESSTVFADKLLFATGVQPWQDGALATVQGKLIMLRDTDGDLKADTTEVWLDGFAAENPQLRANHPTIAADGWLYIASGLRGGKVKSSVPFSKSAPQEVDLSGCDLRLHMLTGQIESIAGPSQFGLSFDRTGNRYGCSNRQPCLEIVSERSDIGLSPLAGLAGSTHEVSKGETASRVLPLVNAWTTSNLHAGQFTAACGVLVTHSRHFASPDSPFATALTCEPTGGLVQRKAIARVDGKSNVIPETWDREWVASRDPWFRPVDLYEGPNGDIYIVDMYRAVIEHPDWVPVELKNRPDQKFGDAHGRIYRVKRKSPVDSIKAATKTPKSLAPDAWLEHPDAWNRSVATRRILQSMHQGANTPAINELVRLCRNENSDVPASARINASLLLSACNALDEVATLKMLGATESELNVAAWKSLHQSQQTWDEAQAERWFEQATFAIHAANSTLDVKREAAWYVASRKSAANNSSQKLSTSFVDNAAKSLATNGGDAHLWMAMSAASDDQLANLLDRYLYHLYRVELPKQNTTIAREAVTRLAIKVAQSLTPEELDGHIQRSVVSLVTNTNPMNRQMDFAFLEGVARAGKLSQSLQPRLEQVIHQAAKSESDPIAQRTAIALLASLQSDESKRLALSLLELPDTQLLKQAIATCSVHATPEFDQWLLEHFPSALPEVRQSIFVAIRNQPKRIAMMLDRLESGAMSTKLFDAIQIQSLSAERNSELAPRISKILAASINSDRQKVVEQYSKQLASLKPDEGGSGKLVFEKNCVACHRINGVGNVVGPDISDSREQTFEKLLISILDPNRAIDANYFRYMARLHDGTVTEGVLKDSNAKTIALHNQNGIRQIERDDIEELKSSSVSLMPDGIEAQISPQDMADLLWYIKNWRYAADQIPANVTIGK